MFSDTVFGKHIIWWDKIFGIKLTLQILDRNERWDRMVEIKLLVDFFWVEEVRKRCCPLLGEWFLSGNGIFIVVIDCFMLSFIRLVVAIHGRCGAVNGRGVLALDHNVGG